MTDNFEFIEHYMVNEGLPLYMKDAGDNFFQIMIVRRGKDHPGLPAANYMFKTYYIDSIESLHFFKDEIIKCCDMFNMRAYVSVNVKSKEQISKHVAFKYSQNILNNEYKKPWRIFDHCFNSCKPTNDKTWIIDIDDEHLNMTDDFISKIKHIINQCRTQYDAIILEQIPTKSGIHLLTRPFNIHDFETLYKMEFSNNEIEIPTIKKNHITLLYENL